MHGPGPCIIAQCRDADLSAVRRKLPVVRRMFIKASAHDELPSNVKVASGRLRWFHADGIRCAPLSDRFASRRLRPAQPGSAWYGACLGRCMRYLTLESHFMKAITSVVATAGFFIALPIHAQAAAGSDSRERPATSSPAPTDDGTNDDAVNRYAIERWSDAVPDNNAGWRMRKSSDMHSQKRDSAASYSFFLNSNSSIFGYIGLPGEPALGPPVSYMRQLSGIDPAAPALPNHWLDPASSGRRVFTVGYVWRDIRLEGSAFSERPGQDSQFGRDDRFRLDSRSSRLSFNPSPNWTWQISRGTLGDLDQFEPNEDIRRSTISATYHRAFKDGSWQTTLAWGRNARKSSEPVTGYLFESTLRFSKTHAVFGRLEQVGSDDLARENALLQRQSFKMNKLSVGYFHRIETSGPIGIDVGGFVSRHFVPSTMVPSYGSEPTAYVMFVRFKLD